jgi:hypothetical protein
VGDKAAACSEEAQRLVALRNVFAAFDLNKNGTIESSELMRLGQSRRELDQVDGAWDTTKNDKLVAQLNGDAKGRVSGANFVSHFNKVLADLDRSKFDETIKQFMLVAESCMGDEYKAQQRVQEYKRHQALAKRGGAKGGNKNSKGLKPRSKSKQVGGQPALGLY